MTNNFRRQRGMTLIVTLMMLIVLTLFAVSAIRFSNTNLKIVGNYQWRLEMETLTDAALEQISSSVDFFNVTPPVGRDICRDGSVVTAGSCTLANPKIGAVEVPQCHFSQVASGYTLKQGEMPPDDNQWRVRATAEDSWSGATVTVTRGLSVRQLSGNCPT